MPLYQYKARKLDGSNVKNVLDAYDERDLKTKLKIEGLYLVESSEVKEKKPSSFLAVRSRINKNDVTTFMRQLAVMARAGVSIEDSILTLKNQESSPPFKKVLMNVYNDLLTGVFLSDAFAKYPKVFPAFFKNMIYIAEISGSLDMVLNRLADYYENDRKIKGKAKSAMIYPMFLLVLIVTVFIALVVFIVPQFRDMIEEMEGEIPTITRVIVDVSDYVTTNFLFIMGGLVGFALFVFIFFKTKPGKIVKDYLKLNAPMVKGITHNLITSRFSRGFSVLVASGMSIMDAIETIGKLMENKVFEKKFRYAIDEVKRGKRIARSVANLNFFPSMMTEMLTVGEKTGNLDSVLDTTADYYDEKLEQAIDKATAALEPMLIIIAGGMVGIVILAVFLPMISLMGSIG